MKRLIAACLLVILALFVGVGQVSADSTKTYRIAWSHYTGWEPWDYAAKFKSGDSSILDKWAKKYGIKIRLDLVNDYVESINLYTSGQYDGCVMTNMDALTIPGVGGIDSTALIVGDFSNGNDGIVMRNGTKVSDLKGREIKLVELSVSHYLLTRALAMNSMTERDVKLVNASDADIASLFIADKNGAVVTWNPPLMQVRNAPGATMVFDSSAIPGEIMDLMVVKSDLPAELKKALVGAWYETMAVMSGKGKEAETAISHMANTAGCTAPEFQAQLKTTAMFYEAKAAVEFTKGDKLKQTMEYVRTFSFDHGLYGQGAPSKDLVGIQFPDQTVMGDSKNVKLRFDASYMEMAANGKL